VTSSLTGFGELTEKDTTVSTLLNSTISQIQTVAYGSGHVVPIKAFKQRLKFGTLFYLMEVS